jgi:hypothetical protein
MEWSEEELEAARRATPGTSHVTHFNNAGCSLPTQKTLDAFIGYLNNEATYGGYVGSFIPILKFFTCS